MKKKQAYPNDVAREYDLEGDGIPAAANEDEVQEEPDDGAEEQPTVTVYHKESALPKVLFYGFVSVLTLGLFAVACAAIANWIYPEDD